MPDMVHHLGNIPQDAPVGGKAHFLDLMIKQGITVPPGVVFGAYVDVTDEWEGVSASLVGDLFAVRSSAEAEDTAERSMAGMFTSKTRIPREDVPRAIADVREHAQRIIGAEIPVIVQTWIEGTVSGVAFSRHPTKSFGEVIVIDAAAGSAERIVSGEITPQRGFIWSDAVLIPDAFPLSRQLTTELANHTRAILRIVESPVDIEWTTDGEQIFLLQARPMTHHPTDKTDESAEGETMRILGGRRDLKLERSDYAETLPRPSPAELELVRAFHAPGGPFAQATRELGMTFDDALAKTYLVTILGWLYADATSEPIQPPNGLLKKIAVSFRLQQELTRFAKTFYSAELVPPPMQNDPADLLRALNGPAGIRYAKAALLARVAQKQTYATPQTLKDIWSARSVWLTTRPADITLQDFDLSADAPTGRRKDWSEPRTMNDLYAVIREDAKDELRPIFSALRKANLLTRPDDLKRNDACADIHLPLTLIWKDLFDLRNAYRRESPSGELHGTGVADGIAEGTAYIATEPTDVSPGSILVVASLTPDWFRYLHADIAGVISETGSLMSHGAIQCRERGIPAIFGAVGATQTLQTGEGVSIDGKSGSIERR